MYTIAAVVVGITEVRGTIRFLPFRLSRVSGDPARRAEGGPHYKAKSEKEISHLGGKSGVRRRHSNTRTHAASGLAHQTKCLLGSLLEVVDQVGHVLVVVVVRVRAGRRVACGIERRESHFGRGLKESRGAAPEYGEPLALEKAGGGRGVLRASRRFQQRGAPPW